MQTLLRTSLILVPLLGGCMTPVYKIPAGFSSTYFRHLHASQPIPPVAAGLSPLRAPEPFAPEAPDSGVVHPLLVE